MAQLTLSQRGEMANNGFFQQKLVAALKKTANYWISLTGGDNNTATYKRKKFGRQIQSGQMPSIQAYAEFFLSQYNNDPAVLTDGMLADSELTDSSATSATYDYFAGIEQKDI